MVRILHIVTYMGRGGLETMLMNYYRHMDRNHVQFDFLVHRDFDADYDEEILAMGGQIHRVSRLIPWSPSYRKELCDFFRSHPEYRIVHVHQDCLSSVALECAKRCGVPIRIAHSHSSSAVKNLKYGIKLFYMKQIPRYATHLFACGQTAGDWMFSGCRYSIVRNAIDCTKYRYSEEIRSVRREELGIGDRKVIGHVGSFSPAKNHAFLLDVFRKLLDQRDDLVLLLVGDGSGRTHIEDTIQAYGLEDHVILTGVRTDVNELLQVMDIFVFPSIYEGLPVTMVEAQAAGLPCVISDGVPSECIMTERLVTRKRLQDSLDSWAEHILGRLEEGHTDHEKELVASGYDIERAAKRLQKFYIRKSGEL